MNGARPPLSPLPIDAVLGDAVAALRRTRALVLIAPPGSGKTTRLPPALLHAIEGDIVVLEPRRLAARAAAQRVASELGERVGDTVGYQVRHERVGTAGTRIWFLTEGVLVRRIVRAPFLEGVGAVVLDEFHERHVETDLALAMLREVRETVRDDLSIAVMSATLDPLPISRFLGDAPIVHAEGRSFPVHVEHLGSMDVKRELEHEVRRAVQKALVDTAGHVLVFLPGVEEIRRAAGALGDVARRGDLAVVPLHGSLSPAEQDRAIAPSAQRKVVLATNVAESSVTIDGVTAVVDSGLARILRADPARGLDVLAVERISLASATQRAGRAGRTSSGVCLRLWSEGEERGMAAFETPELRRTDLAGPTLLVRAFAGRDPAEFGWFQAPESSALAVADRLLRALGALDDRGQPTPTGRRILELPLHPRLGRALVEAQRLDCLPLAAIAVAILAERDFVRRRPREEGDPPIDLSHRLNTFIKLAAAGFTASACRAHDAEVGAVAAVERARRQFAKKSAVPTALDPRSEARVARALVCGFFDRVVLRRSPTADEGVMVGGRGVQWAKGSFHDESELLLALEVGDRGARTQSRQSIVRIAVGIEQEHLPRHLCSVERAVELDEERGRLLVIERERYCDLALAERRLQHAEIPAHSRSQLVELLARDPWRWIGEQPALRSILERLAFLRRVLPERDIPALDDAQLAALLVEALGERADLLALRRADLVSHLSSVVPHALLRDLDRLAPERVTLPSGRRARIEYPSHADPFLASRIQDFFGWQSAPRIAEGRVPLVLHLCAPNQRPVQITSDLASFWRSTWSSVRAELRRRYPRHAWPEDPTTARASERPVKKPPG
ncbi:MAG: ATP-dependent helicase HrpB [Planctomycetota bacterium]